MTLTYTRAKHCLNRSQTTPAMITVQDTCQRVSVKHTKRVGASMYRVYYTVDTVEELEGFYETQEEAEEVAHHTSEEYDAERVEVRDRFDNIIMVIDEEAMVDMEATGI